MFLSQSGLMLDLLVLHGVKAGFQNRLRPDLRSGPPLYLDQILCMWDENQLFYLFSLFK